MRRAQIALAAMLALGTQEVAAQRACLTDAQIDGYVGEQVRAGAPYVDTRDVPNLPLCSGLTLAQQIQRIHAAAFPERRREVVAAVADEVEDEDVQLPDVVPRVRMPAAAPARRKIAAPVAIVRRRATPTPAVARPSGTYYASCRAARAAGAAPLRRGHAGYSGRLDRDGDGIACE